MKKFNSHKSVITDFIFSKSILLILLLIILCNPLFASDEFNVHQSIILTNSASFNRVNEIISVPREALGNVNNNLFPVVTKNDKIFITQIVDKNGDGNWDELLIEVSVAANSKDTLQINWVVKADQIQQKQFTHVRLSLRSNSDTPSAEIYETKRYRGFTQNIAKPFYQMEGPGIENDKVAFRAFFDYRNGKDIYGKIVEEPVLDKVGVGASWHNLQPWGMDICKVGNSLGAGALAVAEHNQIYRLADADTTTFQSLYEGPLQAAFKLSFINWDVAKGKQNGSEIVSMTKGNYYYKNDIELSLNKNQHLVSGIANFGIDRVVYKKNNKSFSSVSTYGPQAEGTMTNLGLAILFPTGEYIANKTADTASTIPNTSYVELKAINQKKFIYFIACWEKSDARFKTQQGFDDYLQNTAQILANPIKIKIISNQ